MVALIELDLRRVHVVIAAGKERARELRLQVVDEIVPSYVAFDGELVALLHLLESEGHVALGTAMGLVQNEENASYT